MKSYKRLKDPIYGYITIPLDYIVNIVDTASFQRLRRIIQTSYAPLYSSAVHNRFVHSIGVFHLGSIVAEKLVFELLQYEVDLDKDEIEHIKEIYLLACLLHDVGHAPFSHTGEMLYLDGEGENSYVKIHEELKAVVSSDSFSLDIPKTASESAAPHEIMSVIVGIRSFGKYFEKAEDRELFARCITGYKYSKKSKLISVKNCFIELLNSKVIDVDRLDYLIRDAYITGFDTVNIDYDRLLNAVTIMDEDDAVKFAYYKDAVSVIENVVYAHDAEKKWIQNHPVVLYESYILQHVFKFLSKKLDTDKARLFSYESLTIGGHILNHNVKVSLLCDDDVIYIMKNILPSKIGDEYFNRGARRHPLWKSEAEYEALFSGSIGGANDSMGQFEQAMNATAVYLSKNSDAWNIDEKSIAKLSADLEALKTNTQLDALTVETQRKDKEKVLRLMSCLVRYASEKNHEGDFVVLEASQFSSGFGKPDFSNMPIIFNTSEDDYVDCTFGSVAKPLKAEVPERKKFYYLFYRRKNEVDTQIDKKLLCEYLAKEFATLQTHRRKKG